MIKTKEYIVVKKYRNRWIPAKEHRCIEAYSRTDVKEVLADMRNGDIPGHSKNPEYKIMEICYCDIENVVKK